MPRYRAFRQFAKPFVEREIEAHTNLTNAACFDFPLGLDSSRRLAMKVWPSRNGSDWSRAAEGVASCECLFGLLV